MRPLSDTYPEYYGLYIPLMKDGNVMAALETNRKELISLFEGIPENKGNFAYAPGKWTIKELLLHLIDTERIFSYRALRFARKDPQMPLPFEENDYAANSMAGKRTIQDLLAEFRSVREATVTLFRSFSDEILLEKGSTMIGETSVLAIGFLIAGHARHHMNILAERYLKTN